MASDSVWNDLTAAALLGTERRAFAAPSAEGALGPLLMGLADRDSEKALLGSAAAMALYRKAGTKPARESQPLPSPAPAESRPRPSATAVAHLSRILTANLHREVLREWLCALDAAGRRVPEELLPALLDTGRKDRALRLAILPVLGERGLWLARLNPDWAYASVGDAAEKPEALESDWQTAQSEARVVLLRQLRAMDPARARELVLSNWAAEEPADRATFVKAFEVGLSDADEPFLESTLDDRRKEVRTAAVELLTQVPGSRMVRRMVERIAPLLSLPVAETVAAVEVEPPGPLVSKGAPFAKLELPEAWDKAMGRDGIEQKPSGAKLGEKAWWLSQMISRIPPRLWNRAWGASADTVLEAVLKSKWRDALIQAMSRAAIRARDADWIEAVLPHRKQGGIDTDDLRTMFEILPPDRREHVVMAILREREKSSMLRKQVEISDDDLMILTEFVPAPWGQELAEEILGRFSLNLAKAKYYDYWCNQFMKAAGAALPPALTLQRTSDWSVPETIGSGFQEFVALLQFRHDMLKELSV